MGRNTGRGKVAYSWISPDPAKAGPTLGVVVVVVVVACMVTLLRYVKRKMVQERNGEEYSQ